MEFYLVRHGEAVSEAVGGQRPLSRVGREDVEQLGRAAAARDVKVSAILHSGILRAQQTAEILDRHLAATSGVREITGLLPEDDPAIAKAELESAQEPVMLVGHLPHVRRLAALLVHGDQDRAVVDFAPATMICLSKDNFQWTFAWILGSQFP